MAKKTRRTLKLDPVKDPIGAWPYPDSSLYFMSGSNNPVEIESAARRGENVGVAAPDTGESVMQSLLALSDPMFTQTRLSRSWFGRGKPVGAAPLVFVDSGAFSEVEFGPKGPTYPKPITESEWIKRLDKYQRLSKELGPQLFAVAPDKIADQAETLERQRHYQPRIQQLHAQGSNILVPVQKGGMRMADFYQQELEALGFKPGDKQVYAAIPLKKDATTLDDLSDFANETVARFGLNCDPETDSPNKRFRVHLLGRGAFSPDYEPTFDAIKRACPAAIVTSDSVRIRSMVGETRPLTQALRHLEALGLSDAKKRKSAALTVVNDLIKTNDTANAIAAGWYDSELADSPEESEAETLQELRGKAEAGQLAGLRGRCPRGTRKVKGVCRIRKTRSR